MATLQAIWLKTHASRNITTWGQHDNALIFGLIFRAVERIGAMADRFNTEKIRAVFCIIRFFQTWLCRLLQTTLANPFDTFCRCILVLFCCCLVQCNCLMW